jgi:hypothetical protein
MKINNSESQKLDEQKFIYDKIFEELNRARDWPIKVSAFSSAIYLALFGFIQSEKTIINCSEKWILSICMSLFLIYTIRIIIRQHLNYIEYRNIQIRLQKMLGIYEWRAENSIIFPKSWTDEKPKNIISGFQGWFFYAFYMIILYSITLCMLVNK